MKKLYLLRHAKADAEADYKDDHEKPLSPKGHSDCRLMGQYLRDHGLIPQKILCSDALRTTQTLHNILPYLGKNPFILHSRRLYLATPGEILKEIATVDPTCESLLVVGHNPGIQQLGLILAGGGAPEYINTMRSKFPTLGLACLDIDVKEWSDIDPGTATLSLFTTPRSLIVQV